MVIVKEDKVNFPSVAYVWTTGNVFYYDLCVVGLSSLLVILLQEIKELNIKTKNWKELLTDEPFTKEDLITVQVISCYEHMMFIC
ncbi:hypothetical protein Pint_27895 [Pistacia integerrima]|uniref:Uncharacterized protein n=1 Tax=Pistacia integerrima TaxID=434235 RepID=A0ACC0YT65_9ROSI|nr:hypothetical protein Pint_27895 [Pistacia integerrima]